MPCFASSIVTGFSRTGHWSADGLDGSCTKAMTCDSVIMTFLCFLVTAEWKMKACNEIWKCKMSENWLDLNRYVCLNLNLSKRIMLQLTSSNLCLLDNSQKLAKSWRKLNMKKVFFYISTVFFWTENMGAERGSLKIIFSAWQRID